MTGSRAGRVAIIGCGLIGAKRAKSLGESTLVACCDAIPDRAAALARACGATSQSDWRDVIAREDVDIVIVATTNESLAPIALAAIEAGKHVLVEKPGARSVGEIEPLITAAKARDVRVRVGFNHRYHPALQKARELIDDGACGDLMFVRGRYGHGGRIGYDKEWRADPALAGGGELIDQGVHVIDLARWFLGDFTRVEGYAGTYFWQMPVDDNAFLLLRTEKNLAAFLHVSCTEWKNLFSFEIYGRNAKLHIEGLGGSYGIEKLSHYQMKPEMGIPDTKVYEFPGSDESWLIEMKRFEEDIQMRRTPDASLAEAKAALQIVEEIYRKSGFDFATSKP